MKMISNEVKLALARRDSVSVVNAVGTRVTCVSGSLWITQHRDTRDVMLDPGDAFVLDRPGAAIIQAIRPSTLLIRELIREETSCDATQQACSVVRAALRRMLPRPANARA